MAFSNNYSFLDRLIHRVAFSTRRAQIAISDMESTLFSKEISNIDHSRPLFITGLPRAGTTILLELLDQLDETASHTYRDMPCIMTPLLWSRLSSSFGQESKPTERAHGDGLTINTDSPEAFEEVLWNTFWKTQYTDDCIKTWGPKKQREFDLFFKDHMKKIIALRSPKQNKSNQAARCAPRYVSKNNLNISRVPYLKESFPKAQIVIPFREPIQHASSLLKQHKNFLAMHKKDRFSKEYMRAVGHYDFGENLKPVNFSNWLNTTPFKDPLTLEFWIDYWIAAYTYLLQQIDRNVGLFCFEALRTQPEASLAQLAQFSNLQAPEALTSQANRIQVRTAHKVDTSSLSSELLLTSSNLHKQMIRKAINVQNTYDHNALSETKSEKETRGTEQHPKEAITADVY